jgi:hypothetical protein
LKEQQLKILKTMNEATNRMDINMFAQAVNLTPEQAIEQVHLMAQEGFLRKVGTGYCLTDMGKNALKISNQVSEDTVFRFYVGVDKPLGFSARSVEEFYRMVKQVCSDSLDFHLYRDDFENWVRQVLGDKELADDFAGFKAYGLNGEELRKALLKAIDTRYGVGELL